MQVPLRVLARPPSGCYGRGGMHSGRNAMKSALALLFLAAAAFAQDQSAIATAQAACGPKDVQFDMKRDSIQHLASHDDAGKATLYFIGDNKGLAQPTVRVWADAVWAGATHTNSYF